jgi:POT family proton-dependent oligopeptide transporter
MALRVADTETQTRQKDLTAHPPGLYALFATEMWERFSFYSMLALFTLYMQDGKDGFSWTPAQATSLYSNYLMFVYASPLVGGWLADKILGYRRAVMIGGFFFMAGHGLLSIPALWAVYLALVCLVIGNGFFKPNVSTMVGNLYPEGSHLKDRAYNIFYMGINIGAFLAPVLMEIVKAKWGFHPAFACAAFGMVISVSILWLFKNKVENPEVLEAKKSGKALPTVGRGAEMEAVSDGRRIGALIVIFLIVIVFWMVFHQNGSTLTYWADDNTEWSVSGTISNAINPFLIVTLTFPLVWFWKWLDRKGKEPSTPVKMCIGMTLTGLSFFILYLGAKQGEAMQVRPESFAAGSFRINERALDSLRNDGVPQNVLDKIQNAKDADGKFIVLDRKFTNKDNQIGEQNLVAALLKILPAEAVAQYRPALLNRAYLFHVSPFWLIIAYAVISLGELMLSPMGLSLVSKVAPLRVRGMMMGGWFVATAIGNKLTAIGVYWSVWKQSSFFIILGSMALIMAVVLATLLKPLKKAMPGV